MQLLQKTMIAVCLACICSEVVSLITGAGWSRRCIKSLAGLYILIVVFHSVPSFSARMADISTPEYTVVDLGTAEELILTKAAKELAAEMKTRCWDLFDTGIELKIRLEETDTGVVVQWAEVVFSADDEEAARGEVLDYLQAELSCVPDWREETLG